jgi:hypothetical protein
MRIRQGRGRPLACVGPPMAGRMPVTEDLPCEWLNTPKLRCFVLLDFESLCAKTYGDAVRSQPKG